MTSPRDELATAAVSTVLRELIDGAASDVAWVLNPGDKGLLASLDEMSAEAASRRPPAGGASIAAHVHHLRYGFHLLNRWNKGEDPFRDADSSASWRHQVVSDAEWRELRDGLRRDAHEWLLALDQPRALDEQALTAMISSAAHLAYHVSAIRQIDRAAIGPAARD
jgi:DinB superfamily